MQTNTIKVTATQYVHGERLSQNVTEFEATLSPEQAAQLVYSMIPAGNITISGAEIKVNTPDKAIVTYFVYSLAN